MDVCHASKTVECEVAGTESDLEIEGQVARMHFAPHYHVELGHAWMMNLWPRVLELHPASVQSILPHLLVSNVLAHVWLVPVVNAHRVER